ncbi:MAG: AAA family ATPase [Candidatus Dojkabacteria bacterium]|nr:AAA family ATPase [Candidatus Dojkabacteria bacterium]
MKVNFKEINIKNFLSFGNNENILKYKSGINVVTGIIEGSTKRNGVGKSALLIDALNFALFGKPSRSDFHINKDDLINDINKKECEVSLKFSIGNNEYILKRGIKPDFLIVYENGKAIQFDSMKNTQKWIEDKLQISQTTFSNIIALNINTSKSFLSLKLTDKRKVIEDVLSLNIYSDMADSFKDKILDSKTKIGLLINDLNHKIKELNAHKENLQEIQKKFLLFEEEKQKICKKIEEKHKNLQEELILLERNYIPIDNLNDQLEFLNKNMTLTNEKLTLIEKEISKVKTQQKNVLQEIDFLNKNDICPYCKSHIKTNSFSLNYLEKCKEELNILNDRMEKLQSKKLEGEKRKESLQKEINNIKESIQKNQLVKNKILVLKENIQHIQQELEKEKNKKFNFDISFIQTKIEKLQIEIEKTQEELNKQQNLYETYKFCREILQEDTGIKNYIFSTIIPAFNKYINDYLKIFGADYVLKFNNNLEETIFTSIGTTRSYENFSSGEKKKIDLAVLLALTDIIKINSSFDCNILILDEVIDTSLDNESVNSLFYFLKNKFSQKFNDKCIYIITHKNELSPDNYDSIVELKKSHNFTFIVNQ